MSAILDRILEADMQNEDHFEALTEDMSIVDLFCSDEELKQGEEMEDDLNEYY